MAQSLPRRDTTHALDILTNINAAIRSDFQHQSRDAMGTPQASRVQRVIGPKSNTTSISTRIGWKLSAFHR
jgi:hypothetical protein